MVTQLGQHVPRLARDTCNISVMGSFPICSTNIKQYNYERVGGKTHRVNLVKDKVDSRNDRRLKRYSSKFNEMFNFYLSSYRSGLIDFCGVGVEVDFDVNGHEGKFSFREYDNGRFKFKTPISRHPNILRGVIIGKKGWGLWVKQWSEGIVECSFTKDEIHQQFTSRGIKIPEPLMIEWDKLILKMKIKRNEKEYERLKSK